MPNPPPPSPSSGPYTAEGGQLAPAKAPTWWNPAWTTPGYWKSWAWLAALIGGFIPVVLPDLLNWAIANADLLIDFAFPTLDPFWKIVVLKIVVTAVLVLRPVKQPNMPAQLLPVAVVSVPPQMSVQIDDGQRVTVDTAVGRPLVDASARPHFPDMAATASQYEADAFFNRFVVPVVSDDETRRGESPK